MRLKAFFFFLIFVAAAPAWAQRTTKRRIVPPMAHSRDCRIDGAIDVTNTVDSSSVIKRCIANAIANNQPVIQLPATPPTGGIKISGSTIDATNRPGITITGTGGTAFNGAGPDYATKVSCFVSPCFDFTGSSFFKLKDLQIINFRPVAILLGRDNAAGGGNGQFCYSQGWRIENVNIVSTPQPTANGGIGAIGILDIGAEDGMIINPFILTDTPIVLTQTNFLSWTSPYQSIQKGCPFSMTGVNMYGGVLESDQSDRPVVLTNIAGGLGFWGVQFMGGNAYLKTENLSGGSPTYKFRVFGQYEGSSGKPGTSGLTTSVGLSDSIFDVSFDSIPPATCFLPTANNLTFTNVDFKCNSTAPFINNAQTGTTFKGGSINTVRGVSASNSVLIGTTVNGTSVAKANISFGPDSNYFLHAADGDAAVGTLGVGGLGISGTPFASLGKPNNGTVLYCSDCTIANPCASGGTGAIAKRLNGTWVCN